MLPTTGLQSSQPTESLRTPAASMTSGNVFSCLILRPSSALSAVLSEKECVLDNVEQIGTGQGEMRAEVVADGVPSLLHLRLPPEYARQCVPGHGRERSGLTLKRLVMNGTPGTESEKDWASEQGCEAHILRIQTPPWSCSSRRSESERRS